MTYRLWTIFPFFLVSIQAQTIDNAAKIGYESISALDLKAHLSILASDSLEGRETTYTGQKKAAEYIASVFRKLNLEPMGDSGTYFQHFEVNVTSVSPKTKVVANIQGNTEEFIRGKDFIAETVGDTTISGPVAFIGYADSKVDSVAMAKLAGRIVFMFIGKREQAYDTSRAMLMWRLYSTNREINAAATLIITDVGGSASFLNIIRVTRTMNPPERNMSLKTTSLVNVPKHIRFFVTPRVAEEVLRSSGKLLLQVQKEALDHSNFSPLFIDSVTLTIHSHLVHEVRRTENVVGVLRGADPCLRDQAVAITAHYDHLGKDSRGVIYYGADDNGSGTSTVLELATAFVKNPIKPKRSILFITMVGEEKGLLGSQYYTSHPIIPLEQTIVDLNVDMIGRVDPEHEVKNEINYAYVIGSDKITVELDSLLKAANKESEQLILDYTYNDEDNPEQYYTRGDHYNFAKHNVPIVFFFTGIHADYHQPTDTIDKILFDKMGRIARLIYDLGWKIGNIDHSLKN